MAITGLPSFKLITRALRVKGPIQYGTGTVGVTQLTGAGFPASGTAGDGAGYAGPGSSYYDSTRGTHWTNTGTMASPYWESVNPFQPGMWGVFSDFRDKPATALTDTTAALFTNNGLRYFGAGQATTDGGSIANASGLGGKTLRMTASATNPGIAAIGGEAGEYQPSLHGMGIVDAEVAQVSAITLRGVGLGFLGLAADNLAPPIQAATTVATLVQNDQALLHFNVGYTATDKWMVAHNKTSTDQATMTAINTGITVAAAGTYQRLRVEVEPVGTAVIMRTFVDKVLVSTVADALDETVGHSPVLFIESTSAAIKAQDVRRFMFAAGRV